MTVFEELFKVVSSTGFKQRELETDSEYLTALVKWASEATKVPDEVWNNLSIQAQTWVLNSAKAINSLLPIPICEGFEYKDVPEIKSGRIASTKENQANLPKVLAATAKLKKTPAQKTVGIVDAIRQILIRKPDWSNKQVHEYLLANGYPNAKFETLAVNAGDIRRTIFVARNLGYWNETKFNEDRKAEKEEQKAAS